VGGEDVLEEVRDMGIKTLEDLDKIARDSGFYELARGLVGTTERGIIRCLLMVLDAKRYFDEAWNEKWVGIDRLTCEVLAKAGVDVNIIAENTQIRDGGPITRR
jgi:hypothetical protein